MRLKGGYFSTKLLSYSGCCTGMYLQMTARMLPVRAIQTTEIAEGTRAAN